MRFVEGSGDLKILSDQLVIRMEYPRGGDPDCRLLLEVARVKVPDDAGKVFRRGMRRGCKSCVFQQNGESEEENERLHGA